MSILLKDLVGFIPFVMEVDDDDNELAQFEVLCRVSFLEHKIGASKLCLLSMVGPVMQSSQKVCSKPIEGLHSLGYIFCNMFSRIIYSFVKKKQIEFSCHTCTTQYDLIWNLIYYRCHDKVIDERRVFFHGICG